MISSKQNPKLKLVRALTGRAKERQAVGGFVAEGVRLVEEALGARWPFQFVLYSHPLNERGERLLAGLLTAGIATEEVAPHLLNAVSATKTSQGILAVLDLPESNPPLVEVDFLLIPDQVRDPGNLGTLLRTADAAGVQAVLIPPQTSDPFNPKTVRAGMGAHFHIPIHRLTWEEIETALEAARGKSSEKVAVYLAEAGARACWETDLAKPLALIIGGEADGASSPARQLASASVGIPMRGAAESLNAAAAGAVLLFEVVRQREEIA